MQLIWISEVKAKEVIDKVLLGQIYRFDAVNQHEKQGEA
jgi:thioester reductase-like protein